MQFSGEGYIMKTRSHGEKSAIVTLICPEHGKVVGYVQGAFSKRNLGIYQLGNRVSFNAYARVAENMMSFKGVELVSSHITDFMQSEEKTDALLSMSRLVDACVAENDDLGDLYAAIDGFFTHIHDKNWLAYYSFFEFYLLDFLGIGLDIGRCAVTGTRHDLRYVSPKTGRAVCASVGEPYKDKLYAYPKYIAEHNYAPREQEIANVLTMTGDFLKRHFLQPHNLQLPQNRASLLNMMKIKL